jgi:2'-5' RNA ligase
VAFLVIRFAEVDRVVRDHRLRHDPWARVGVPAHVTVHFPWLPADTVDAGALAAVRDLARTVEPFDVTFSRLRWFDSSVLWLEPTPEQPLRELAQRSAGRWPEFPLYGGQFEDVIPHLTVGVLADDGDPAALRAVEQDLSARLPLRDRASEISWLGLEPDGRWQARSTFPLGVLIGGSPVSCAI